MSSSDEEDYIFYGTPLNRYDEETLRKRKTTENEGQYVKDEQGRKRFHGAFTGGFSAGFFNTVGSLEGWEPSSFVSSRASKAKIKPQTAEDFMDDEDKGEFGICPMTLKVKSGYGRTDGKKETEKKFDSSYGADSVSSVLKELLKPVKQTVGVKLLMKMGWKPGQGVGPRMTKSEKQVLRSVLSNKKIYSCAPEGPDESEDEEDVIADVTFAPEDYTLHLMHPKRDTFGLGYMGMDRKSVLSGKRAAFSTLTVEGKRIHGQAFGVGALEEEDGDIYATEDMSQYDFTLGGEKSADYSKIKLPGEPQRDKCIDGFCLGTEPILKVKLFPVEKIPPGYTPRFGVRKSRFEPLDNRQTKVTQQPIAGPQERAIVFEDETSNFPKFETKNDLKQQPEYPSTKRGVISDSGFKPFAADPEKQARYNKYIKCKQAGVHGGLESLQPKTMTEWEKEREKMEFEKAYKLYKPLSIELADRFTTGKHLDDDGKILNDSAEDDRDPEGKIRREAAKKEMYGDLTRRVYRWVPREKVLHLFNIPEPEIDKSLEECVKATKRNRNRGNIFRNLFANTSLSDYVESEKSPQVFETQEVISVNIKESEQNVDNNEQEDAPSVEKNIDLFKSIFLSSDEEDETESEKNPGLESEPKRVDISPPRGIFANLDLDSLRVEAKTCDTTENDNENSGIKALPKNGSVDTDACSPGINALPKNVSVDTDAYSPEVERNVYGPALPTNFSVNYSDVTKHLIRKKNLKDQMVDEIWVEKSAKHERKHKKNENRHKHKHKHKDKKHKKRHK